MANGESQGTPGLLSFVEAGWQVDIIGHFTDDQLRDVGLSMVAADVS
jgi:hypothetical protein